MGGEGEKQPKVFLSYAWGDEEYDSRVIDLAERLVRSGVETVFDKWHLAPGNDAYAFMERSVTDESVTHVLMLCEPRYAAKADDRSGGAGAETLIISPQVYRDTKQEKFIPVLMKRNEDGSAAVPAYLESRIYIDFSRAETEVAQYSRLLEHLWGRPALRPPPLGGRPQFMDATCPQLLTGYSLEQYKDAVRRGRPNATGYLSAYLGHLLEAFRAEVLPTDMLRDRVRSAREESLTRFVPYRDEFVDAISFVAEFTDDGATVDRLHRFRRLRGGESISHGTKCKACR